MQSYSDPRGSFVSGKTPALWAAILLGVSALVEFMLIFVNAAQLYLASAHPETAAAALGNGDADFTEMPGGAVQAGVGLIAAGVGLFYIPLVIATIVVFLIWQHRAYKNLPPLGVRNPQYATGWVIGSWFVPFLNLVLLFQITKEIWMESDPASVPSPGEDTANFNAFEHFQNSVPLLTAWWAFWIVSNIANNASSRLSWRATSLEDNVIACWVGIVAAILSIIAAILAIRVVRGITDRQEQRHRKLLANAFSLQTPGLGTNEPPPSYSSMPQPPTYR